MLRFGLALHEPRQVVAVDVRQRRPGQHDVGAIQHDTVHGLMAIGRGQDPHRLLRKRQRNHSLNGDVIVGEQERAHTELLSVSACAAAGNRVRLRPA
jgi:hypothetical protein